MKAELGTATGKFSQGGCLLNERKSERDYAVISMRKCCLICCCCPSLNEHSIFYLGEGGWENSGRMN